MTKNPNPKLTKKTAYTGFEQGPIRPPSEAESLLIRVTRNCPWNRCEFCPVYKGARFSVRSADHVKRDIDQIHLILDKMHQASPAGFTHPDPGRMEDIADPGEPGNRQALQAALHWMNSGMQSIFIQDANSLILKPGELIDILTHLKQRFPWVRRITSYARSHTISRISDADMNAIGAAGLNRIHIGLESGSDAVLSLMKKGATKAVHIKAGRRVKQAGIELSEYVMPGLGGRALSMDHARETADALNQINPEFIRLRTLAIPTHLGLYDDFQSGRFEKLTDVMTVKEILAFIRDLTGITTRLKSDHILNLFQDLEGVLPEDKARLTGMLQTFLDLDPELQCRYQVGRRLGLVAGLDDMDTPAVQRRIDEVCRQHGITSDTVDAVIDELMRRFI